MKFDKNQCARCPFRRSSAPGWLGEYGLTGVTSSIWKGFPFFCHPKIDYEQADWEARAMESGTLCAGALVFAHKMLAPDREIKHEQVRKARLEVLSRMDTIECMEPQEFVKHHSPERKKKS